jgi:AcrR family transcriptional regulator
MAWSDGAALDGPDKGRVEIVQAAAELFMEQGYAATTLDAVAERLGGTKGRIYYRYDSKAELYFDVQRSAMESLMAEVVPLARGGGTPIEQLYRMALRHTEILLKDLPLQKVAMQGLERHLIASGGPRHLRSLRDLVRMRDDYEQIFAEVIDEGIRAGQFVDLPPRLATKPFFGTLNWATVWYTPRRSQGPESVDRVVRMLAGFAVRGLTREERNDVV